MTSLDEEVTLLDEEVTSLDEEVTSLDEDVTSLDEEVTSFGRHGDAPQKPILKLSEDGNNYKSSVVRR